MDNKSKERLSKVHPVLAEKVERMITKLNGQGLDVRVVQGLRTAEEQQKLYNQGRTTPGKRVTNAKPYQSNHNYGLAVDLCPFTNNQPDWNNTKGFLAISRAAKDEGLESGADWKFVDMPHVQLKGMSIKECFTHYQKDGLNAVWKRMSEILGGSPFTPQFVPKKDDLIEYGDKGDEVKRLQEQLRFLNYLRPHEIDGHFGKITKNAVIGFQRQNGLGADGIVGDNTKAMLKKRVDEKNLAAASKIDSNAALNVDFPPNEALARPKQENAVKSPVIAKETTFEPERSIPQMPHITESDELGNSANSDTPNASAQDNQPPPQELKKERPSTFTRWMTAIFTAIGTFFVSIGTYLGSDVPARIANRAVDNADREMLPVILGGLLFLLLFAGIGVGLIALAAWFYDRSRQGANRLNVVKVEAAKEPEKATVDFTLN